MDIQEELSLTRDNGTTKKPRKVCEISEFSYNRNIFQLPQDACLYQIVFPALL